MVRFKRNQGIAEPKVPHERHCLPGEGVEWSDKVLGTYTFLFVGIKYCCKRICFDGRRIC